MRYLLDHGADINAQTISGRTPLMFAVQFGHVNLVIMLLGRSKDLLLEASDLEGFTALIIAIEMGDAGKRPFFSAYSIHKLFIPRSSYCDHNHP